MTYPREASNAALMSTRPPPVPYISMTPGNGPAPAKKPKRHTVVVNSVPLSGHE